VPQIINVEDIVDAPNGKPDEKIVMTYLCLLYIEISKLAVQQKAVKSILQAVELTKKHKELAESYETGAEALLAWIESALARSIEPGTVPGLSSVAPRAVETAARRAARRGTVARAAYQRPARCGTVARTASRRAERRAVSVACIACRRAARARTVAAPRARAAGSAMSALPSTVLRSPDVLLEILHYVRDGADFLQCELVCVAWRRAVDAEALWEPRPIQYGDFFLIDAAAGRRSVLETAALHAIRDIQRSTESAFDSVLGTIKLRGLIESLYNRCSHHDCPQPRFTDGAVLALCEIVELWMANMLEASLRLSIHRVRTIEGNDDPELPAMPENGAIVGTVDLTLQLILYKNNTGQESANSTLINIGNWLDGVEQSAASHGTELGSCGRMTKERRQRILDQLVSECSSSECTRIVRRIARRAGVAGITGATMDSAFCYCLGALGAILKNVYHLHEPIVSASELPPSDDDDYSSVDETSDDEDSTPRYLPGLELENWVQPEIRYPRSSAAPLTVTSATVAYAAAALKIADSYYPSRLDDDSDSEDSGSSSDEQPDEISVDLPSTSLAWLF